MKDSLVRQLPDEIVNLIVFWWQELERRRLALIELRRAIDRNRRNWKDGGGAGTWGLPWYPQVGSEVHGYVADETRGIWTKWKPDAYGPGF